MNKKIVFKSHDRTSSNCFPKLALSYLGYKKNYFMKKEKGKRKPIKNSSSITSMPLFLNLLRFIFKEVKNLYHKTSIKVLRDPLRSID